MENLAITPISKFYEAYESVIKRGKDELNLNFYIKKRVTTLYVVLKNSMI